MGRLTACINPVPLIELTSRQQQPQRPLLDWLRVECPEKEEGRIQKAKAAVIFAVQSNRDGRVVNSLERRVPDGRENAWPCRANCFQYPGGRFITPRRPAGKAVGAMRYSRFVTCYPWAQSECPAFVAPGPSGSTKKPARALTAYFLKLEPTLCDLVSRACALTPAEIELVWKTAPPRMPMPAPTTVEIALQAVTRPDPARLAC